MGRFFSGGLLAVVADAASWRTFVLDWDDAKTSPPTTDFRKTYTSSGKKTYLQVCKDTVAGAIFATGKYSLLKPVDFSDGVVCHSNPMYVQAPANGKVVAFTYSVEPSDVSHPLFDSGVLAEAWNLAKDAATKDNLGTAAVTAVGTTDIWKDIKKTGGVPYASSGYVATKYLTVRNFIKSVAGGNLLTRGETDGGLPTTAAVDLTAGLIADLFAVELAKHTDFTANTLANYANCADSYVATGANFACSYTIRADKLLTSDAYVEKGSAAVFTAVNAKLVTAKDTVFAAFRANHSAAALKDWRTKLDADATTSTASVLHAGLAGTAATGFATLAEGSTAPAKSVVTGAGYPFAEAGGHTLTAGADAGFALTVTIAMGAMPNPLVCTDAMMAKGFQLAIQSYSDWTNFGTGSAAVKVKIAPASAAGSVTLKATLGMKVPGGHPHRSRIQKLIEDITPSEILMGFTRGLARTPDTAVPNTAAAVGCGAMLATVTGVTRSKTLDMYTAPAASLANTDYAGSKTIKVSGVLTLPVVDAEKAVAFPDIEDMGKNGVAALMRTILPATASIQALFEATHVTLKKGDISLGAKTTTAKPARRGLATKNLISLPFMVELKKSDKLKVSASDDTKKDKVVTDAGTTIQAALKAAATPAQKKAIAEAMLLTAVSKYKADNADGKAARKTKFTAAFGAEGLDTADKSFDITEQKKKAAVPSSAFLPLVSGIALLLAGVVALF